MAYSIAIDFESKNITIHKKGIGIVLKEPAIVVTRVTKRQPMLVASGNRAMELKGRLNPDERIMAPITNGRINNPKACELMMSDFISKIANSTLLRHKINALVCVSCGLTAAERKDIESCLIASGASQVTIIESPLSMLQLIKESYALTINVGYELTEVAIATDEGIICGCSADIALTAMAEAVCSYLKLKYLIEIGKTTGSKLLMSIGSMNIKDMSSMFVQGRCLNENIPKRIEITSADIRKAITPLLEKIVEVINSVMCSCPSNLVHDIFNSGMVLAGQGMKIEGLGQYLADRNHVMCRILPNYSDVIAIGGGMLLENSDKLERLLAFNKRSA